MNPTTNEAKSSSWSFERRSLGAYGGPLDDLERDRPALQTCGSTASSAASPARSPRRGRRGPGHAPAPGNRRRELPSALFALRLGPADTRSSNRARGRVAGAIGLPEQRFAASLDVSIAVSSTSRGRGHGEHRGLGDRGSRELGSDDRGWSSARGDVAHHGVALNARL